MLSRDLFYIVRQEFLRLLGAPDVRIYLDAADALASESALRTDKLGREEALSLVESVVNQHAAVELENAAGLSTREKARAVLERLTGAGWLEAEDRADYQKLVGVSVQAAMLLDVLRKIARPGAAVFSDKLVATYNLLHGGNLNDEPWQTVEMCVENVRLGIQELRNVAKSVEQHTRRQLDAQSLRENLEVIFDQYAVQVGRGAYAELVRARLPTRLPEAREVVNRLRNDLELLNRMEAEVYRRQPEGGTAMATVQNRLRELSEALDRVVPTAEEVDRCTADFTRKSLARFRYLQEVTGEQRSVVQRFFEEINTLFAGKRIRDADMILDREVPALRISEVKLPAGLDSLYNPPLRHSLGEVEPLDEETSDEQRDRSCQQFAATMRETLTVARANHFAAEAFGKLGDRISSKRLMTSDPAAQWQVFDDQLADLLSCLLHAEARGARFAVETSRDLENPAGDQRERDQVLGRIQLERFILAKK